MPSVSETCEVDGRVLDGVDEGRGDPDAARRLAWQTTRTRESHPHRHLNPSARAVQNAAVETGRDAKLARPSKLHGGGLGDEAPEILDEIHAADSEARRQGQIQTPRSVLPSSSGGSRERSDETIGQEGISQRGRGRVIGRLRARVEPWGEESTRRGRYGIAAMAADFCRNALFRLPLVVRSLAARFASR